MQDDLKRTVRIVKDSRVGTDERGRTVWTGPVETAELELVSTVMLRKIIDSGDEARKERLRKASAEKEGILARDASSDEFRIIDDEDLKAAIDSAAGAASHAPHADVVQEPVIRSTEQAEELSLVSTQALRFMLGQDEAPADPDDDDALPGKGGGFDPYNNA